MSFCLKEIRESVLLWRSNSSKDNEALKSFLDRKTTINGYIFVQTSGHRSFINAKNSVGTDLSIIDCDAPDTPSEFYDNLKKKLKSGVLS